MTPETFAQCKELMRPVQKKIIEFGSDTDSDKSTEVQVSGLVYVYTSYSYTHTSLCCSS